MTSVPARGCHSEALPGNRENAWPAVVGILVAGAAAWAALWYVMNA